MTLLVLGLFLAQIPPSSIEWPCQDRVLWQNLSRFAREHELVDGKDEIPQNLQVAREFVAEKFALSLHWPSKASLARLPSYSMINEQIDLNRRFRVWCTEQWQLDPRNERYYFAMHEEAEEIWQALDKMQDATSFYFSLHVRRQRAAAVRERIGHEAYNLGLWPHPLPLWRFVRED